MSVHEVLAIVERDNPMLKPFESKGRALDVYAEGARSWMAPMVGAGTFMTPYPGQESSTMAKGSFMISVEQEIPNPGRLKANRAFLESLSAVQHNARRQQLNELRFEARENYYRWLVALSRRNALAQSAQTLILMKQLAEVRFPYNKDGVGEIYKVDSKIAELGAMTEMNEGEIASARARLLSLMNMPPETPLAIDTAAQAVSHTVPTDTVGLYARRSDVRQLDLQIRAMELNRSLQQAKSRPDFKLRFDHMQTYGGSAPSQFTAMGMISIPVAPWSSRMYKTEARGMAIDIQAMQDERKAILNQASGKLFGMAKQLDAMDRQLKGYRQSILPALRKNFEAALLGYEENRAQLSVVLGAWEALNMMQLEYFEKQEAWYMMLAECEKELEL